MQFEIPVALNFGLSNGLLSFILSGATKQELFWKRTIYPSATKDIKKKHAMKLIYGDTEALFCWHFDLAFLFDFLLGHLHY